MVRYDLEKSICVVGSGAAGLITAHVLLKDGFTNVEILTRDESSGGVWAEERVYPGLSLNNVHGEFCFSALPMPAPSYAGKTGGRLAGEDLRAYMESFAERFLKGRIRYAVEVLTIRRAESTGDLWAHDASSLSGNSRWIVNVRHVKTGQTSEKRYDRIVLCTGGCSEPYVPENLTPQVARANGFRGPVCHSFDFRKHVDEVLLAVKPQNNDEPGVAVVVGGGKSAQDMAAFLANHNRKVIMVFETADAIVAAPIPLPAFIRKSRFLAILSPYHETRTLLERFLHKTWLGSKIVHGIWTALTQSSFSALSIPKYSPLRNAHPLFWAVRTNDEGIGGPDRFHSLVNDGRISLVAPARVVRIDSQAVVLNDGRTIVADAVLLGTGFSSSWSRILDASTMRDIGLDRHSPAELSAQDIKYFDEYRSLRDSGHDFHKMTTDSTLAATIHRGIVPARNIARRDFAVNGAAISTNNGYTFEVAAHWIASYFRDDAFMKKRLPKTPSEAEHEAEVHNAWLRKRFPGMFGWLNESYSTDMPFWNWAQYADTLLEDMDLPVLRSGGNSLTWPFKVVKIEEIARLTEEREQKRREYLK